MLIQNPSFRFEHGVLFSCRTDISAFRCSANSIVTSIKKPNERVLMKLLYSFSVPILTYACEVKRFSYSDMRDCHVAINDAIRRIFSFNRWESIRHLRESFGYRDLYTIFSLRERCFMNQIRTLNNHILRSILNFLCTFDDSALLLFMWSCWYVLSSF